MGKNENLSKNVASHKDEKLPLEKSDVEKDDIKIVNKSSNIKNDIEDMLSE